MEVRLTAMELQLLAFLMSRPNRVLTREAILSTVWGYDASGDVRLVDAHVRRLRLKLEDDPGRPLLIETVRGFGYRLNQPGE